jgi:hypothetical protein
MAFEILTSDAYFLPDQVQKKQTALKRQILSYFPAAVGNSKMTITRLLREIPSQLDELTDEIGSKVRPLLDELKKNDYFVGLLNSKDTAFVQKATAGGRVLVNKHRFKTSSQFADPENPTVEEFLQCTDYLEDLDVVSLYPTAMTKFQYPIGHALTAEQEVVGKMGIYNCMVKPPKNILNPLLAQKVDGCLTYHLNDREQVLSSVMIASLRKRGYEIDVVVRDGRAGLYWNETAPIFRKYMEKTFEAKAAAKRKAKALGQKDTPEYRVSKLMLNSPYGKMLQRPVYEQIMWVNPKTALGDITHIISVGDIVGQIDFGDRTAMKVVLNNEEDMDARCTKPNHLGIFILDYSKEVVFQKLDVLNPEDGSLQQRMRELFYMCDTDSFFVHRSVGARIARGDAMGDIDNELGENAKITEAYFVQNKLYLLKYMVLDEKSKKVSWEYKLKGAGINDKELKKQPEVFRTMVEGVREGKPHMRDADVDLIIESARDLANKRIAKADSHSVLKEREEKKLKDLLDKKSLGVVEETVWISNEVFYLRTADGRTIHEGVNENTLKQHPNIYRQIRDGSVALYKDDNFFKRSGLFGASAGAYGACKIVCRESNKLVGLSKKHGRVDLGLEASVPHGFEHPTLSKLQRMCSIFERKCLHASFFAMRN